MKLNNLISSPHWDVSDSIIPLRDSVGLLYRVWAFPKPSAPFARWEIGIVSHAMLTLPNVNAPISRHMAVVKHNPTLLQSAEMRVAVLALNTMTTQFERDWLPRDSLGKLNRKLFMRMWRRGWRGVNKYESA